FGRPASTGRLPALLSLKTGAPIVVGACVRRPGRRFLYRLALLEAGRERDAEAVALLTQQIVATLERWVRDDPTQWRWIHWRAAADRRRSSRPTSRIRPTSRRCSTRWPRLAISTSSFTTPRSARSKRRWTCGPTNGTCRWR